MMSAVRVCVVLCFFSSGIAGAEEYERTKYPFGLANSFFSVNAGFIDYDFSSAQLEPGYRAGTIRTPGAAVRLEIGHNFNNYLSAQLLYMRPLKWVRYEEVPEAAGTPGGHSVLTNMAGLTLRTTAPAGGPFSLYFEGGLGIITRGGFKVGGRYAVQEANYPTILFGAGLKYRLSNAWDLQVSAAYSPPEESIRQPHTLVLSGGFVVNTRNPSGSTWRPTRPKSAFPQNLVQVGYSTDRYGTGVNHFVSGGKIPVFWGGNAHVRDGFMFLYQRNIYSRKVFSFDMGVSYSRFTSERDGMEFKAASVFPQFKFRIVRTGVADFYLTYSLAGPAYLSQTTIDGINTGRHFTFQDLLGAGFYLGPGKHINIEARIGHYSNGNIYPRNPGVKVPLTFNLGFAF